MSARPGSTFRIVDDGDGERQALTNAERQFAGPLIEMVREAEIGTSFSMRAAATARGR